jgi:hypothetical protein
MKQQSAERHAVPLVHIILISSQPVFALLKGISCTDKILWENGNTGEQYKVDPPHEGYQVFCEVCIKWLACLPRVR